MEVHCRLVHVDSLPAGLTVSSSVRPRVLCLVCRIPSDRPYVVVEDELRGPISFSTSAALSDFVCFRQVSLGEGMEENDGEAVGVF